MKSESFHEKALADLIEGKMRSWGCDVRRDSAGIRTGSDTGNLYVKAERRLNAPTLLLSAHLDTVGPALCVKPFLNRRTIRGDGKGVLGADDKAGLAIAMELIREVASGAIEGCNLEALFTVAEEKGILGIKYARKAWLSSKCALVIDGTGSPYSVVTASPTQMNITMVFRGKKAHSGIEPEKGVSAIKAASNSISMMRLGRIDAKTTANIGVINGGSALNIVPDLVEVKGEARSLDRKRLERQIQSMSEAARRGAAEVGASVSIKTEKAYEGFALDAKDPLVKLVLSAGRTLNMSLKTCSSGGGSDANQLNAWGIRAVVIHTGAHNTNSEKEYLNLGEFHKAYALCRRVVETFGDRGAIC